MSVSFKSFAIIILFIGCFCIVSCSSDDKDGKQSTAFKKTLPEAKGDHGEMIVVMDSAQWEGELGHSVRAIYAGRYPSLPQSEPLFKLLHVRPFLMTKLLALHKNILYVTTFDSQTYDSKSMRNYFSESSIVKIKKDPSLFYMINKDKYAQNQMLVYFFGKDEKSLIQNLKEHKDNLQKSILDVERGRLQKEHRRGLQKSLIKEVKKRFDYSVEIPKQYKLADMKDDFIWLRHPEMAFDKNMLFAVKDYVSEGQLKPDSILQWRQDLCKQYVYGDPENKNSFVTIQSLEPPVFKTMELNGHYAIEMRGLWKTNNISMGGPFLGYAVVDEKKGKIYYMEGLVYAPGIKKRELIKQVEAIMWTIKF